MSNDNRPPKIPTSQLIFPNAEATNANQIQNLLNIGSFALHALLRPEPHGNSIPGTRADFSKNAELAAEKTFIKVLDTFNQLLFDRERWSMEPQRKLAARFDEAHSLNLKYLESQAEFARLMTTPHFRFKPQILRLKDGRMLAMLGHVDDLDNAICGVGATVEAALAAFDNTCANGVPATIAEYMQKREADLEAGKTPEQYPKNEQTHTAEKVDDRRTKSVRKPRKSGEK